MFLTIGSASHFWLTLTAWPYMYDIKGQFSRTVVLPFYLEAKMGRCEAPKTNFQKYLGKHYWCIQAGHAIKKVFEQFFVCLKSSWIVVDALRSKKDAKSDNKLFASPLKNLQLLLNSLRSMFQPEFKIVIFLNKSVTICNFADSLSQTGNRLNKLHVDSLLISASHQNLLLGCANLTRKLYLLSRNTW